MCVCVCLLPLLKPDPFSLSLSLSLSPLFHLTLSTHSFCSFVYPNTQVPRHVTSPSVSGFRIESNAELFGSTYYKLFPITDRIVPQTKLRQVAFYDFAAEAQRAPDSS